MKNIQIIDGAVNTSFSIYAIPDHAFKKFFPGRKQDIEFIEDVVRRIGERKAGQLMKFTWNSRQEKSKVKGIHGTLFIGLQYRKAIYPNKRESDMDDPEIQKSILGAREMISHAARSRKAQ